MSEASPPASRPAALRAWLGRHAYLALAAGALLVLTRTVTFSPPPQVRPDPAAGGGADHPLPVQEFSSDLRNPQVLQLRAVLRRYDDAALPVSAGDHALDERGAVLSAPVVTAVLGTEAAIDQRVRLEGGDLELELALKATPRRQTGAGAAAGALLEHALTIRSKRERWTGVTERVVLDTAGVLEGLEGRGHRWVFTVDEHLFSLDLEAQRPLGAV